MAVFGEGTCLEERNLGHGAPATHLQFDLAATRAGSRSPLPSTDEMLVTIPSVRSLSLGSGSQDGVYDQPDEDMTFVSAIAYDMLGDFLLVGKEDYSVSSCDGKTGRRIRLLFNHVASIKALHVVASASKQYLVSVDSAGLLMVHHVQISDKQLQVEKLFTHRASVTGIRQLLYNNHAPTLLVCSGNKAKLLSISTGEHFASQEAVVPDTVEHCTWAQHPVDDSLIVCLQGRAVYYYSWSSL
ncbi:hypothetical protein F5Y18DRAFT_406966 [Xylariaceae sp. FL1019]|nr:hypothetical protein F5Y18DRAFT_406966 [Xylariaceae sp. FL1019]